jgi:hypothetical protein
LSHFTSNNSNEIFLNEIIIKVKVRKIEYFNYIFYDKLKMTEYKLTYYDIKGRGEVARLIFAAAGQKFEDIRLEYRNSTEFKSIAPFGQVKLNK